MNDVLPGDLIDISLMFRRDEVSGGYEDDLQHKEWLALVLKCRNEPQVFVVVTSLGRVLTVGMSGWESHVTKVIVR